MVSKCTSRKMGKRISNSEASKGKKSVFQLLSYAWHREEGKTYRPKRLTSGNSGVLGQGHEKTVAFPLQKTT